MSLSNSEKNITSNILDEILDSSLKDLNLEINKLSDELKQSVNNTNNDLNDSEDSNNDSENESEADNEDEEFEKDNEEQNDNNQEFIELTYEEIIPIINQKYISIIQNLNSFFKNHKKLCYTIKQDLDQIIEKSNNNKYAILNILTDNFLYCLEEIKDLNSDYFCYQEEKKIKNKNGKIIKSKITKIGENTTLKSILPNLKTKTKQILLKDIFEIFELLVYEDNEQYFFHNEYIEYVKTNFSSNKNYNKILLVIDNINNIFSNFDENDISEQIQQSIEQEKRLKDEKRNKKSKKDSKKSSNGMPNIGENFMKGIEDTKIASLAKSISEKININDFPVLNDPSKLLSSLSNPTSQDGEQGIGDLLQFVIGEVQTAFKDGNGLKEGDLVNEAQNIMGKFGNIAGFDPSKIMNNPNLNLDKFADIFKDMSKNFQEK